MSLIILQGAMAAGMFLVLMLGVGLAIGVPIIGAVIYNSEKKKSIEKNKPISQGWLLLQGLIGGLAIVIGGFIFLIILLSFFIKNID